MPAVSLPSIPRFLQTNTAASDGAAATSHQVSFLNVIRASGGRICPSCLVLVISYDGGSSDQVSSVTDSSGNTWTRGTSANDNANQVHCEIWYAQNAKGAEKPTVTVSMSSSVKAKLAVAELDQVAPVSPVDGSSTPLDKTTARIDTTNSTSRTSAASNSTKRVGMVEVFIAAIGWNDARTISAAGAGWSTASIVQLSGGSSNLGVGIENKSAETKNINGTNGIGRFTMSGAAGTVPAGVLCLAFFRDAVSTDNDQDGYHQNIEGARNVFTATSPNLVYRSSASAPTGGTGGSEYTQAFAWNSKFYPPAGVGVDNVRSKYFNVTDGFDDGAFFFNFLRYSFNDNQAGQSLDVNDDLAAFGGLGGASDIITVNPNSPGEYSFDVYGDIDVDPDQATSAFKIVEEGDGFGTGTSNYINVAGYAGSVPQYIVHRLTYPRKGSYLPQKNALRPRPFAPGRDRKNLKSWIY